MGEIFTNILHAHGPESVAFYGSGQLDTETVYLISKLFKGHLGCNNTDSNSRLCMAAAVAGYRTSLGSDGPPCCYDDIELADVILIIGSNMAEAHPVTFDRIKASKKARTEQQIVVIDPRRTATAEAADLHLAVAPGSDIALLNALGRMLVTSGGTDEPFIAEHTSGFAEYRDFLLKQDLRELIALTGLEKSAVSRLARLIGGAKGFLVDAALGTSDALEWSTANRASFFPWYAALNNGLRVTAVGGEDSITNLHAWKLIGSQRTYVFSCDRGLSAESWLENLRRGQAFVSNGPLLQLAVNGKKPGEDVRLPPGGRQVRVEATVQSIVPLERAWLVFRGETLAEVPLGGDRRTASLETELKLERSGWLILRAEGKPAERAPLDASYAQAFTNPVWISVGGAPVRDRAAAEYGMKWIDKLRALAEAHPGWRSEREKDHVFAQLAAARKVYEGFAAESGR